MHAFNDAPRLSRMFRMQWEETQQAYVLLYPEGMVKLNHSAAEILRRCDGRSGVAAIVEQLQAAFATTGLDAEVRAFIADARARGWLV